MQPDTQIRLFSMRENHLTTSITIDITIAQLSDPPRFYCLSYVWGHRPVRPDIYYKHQAISITKNLWDALQRLRYMLPSETLFWADQISIDQRDNNPEKDHQVALMSKIFPRAVDVLCWLGESDRYTECAYATLKELAPTREQPVLLAELGGAYCDPKYLKSKAQLEKEASLAAFFSRNWFRRVWTLQEVCVPMTGEPLVLCGEHVIGWHDVWGAVTALGQSLGPQGSVEVLSAHVGHALTMFDVYFEHWKGPVRLSTLLRDQHTRREASEDRDRIFAMLGMLGHAQDLYPAPSYKMSFSAVCNVYTRSMIRIEGNLDAIGLGRIMAPGSGWPSWFSGPETELGVPYKGRRRADSVTGNTVPMIEDAESSLDVILRLFGRSIDHISNLHDFCGLLSKGQRWRDILSSFRSYTLRLELPEVYTRTDDIMATAVLKTLLMDDFYIGCTYESLKAVYSHGLYCNVHRRGARISAATAAVNDVGLPVRTQERWTLNSLYELTQSLFDLEGCTTEYWALGRATVLTDDIRVDGEMVERLEAEVVKDFTEEIQTLVRRGLKLAVTSCGLLALVPGTAEIGDELW